MAGDLASAWGMAGPGRRRQGAVKSESAAAAVPVVPDRQGAGGSGPPGPDGDFRGAQLAGAVVLSWGETGWRCGADPGIRFRRSAPPIRECRNRRQSARTSGPEPAWPSRRPAVPLDFLREFEGVRQALSGHPPGYRRNVPAASCSVVGSDCTVAFSCRMIPTTLTSAWSPRHNLRMTHARAPRSGTGWLKCSMTLRT